MFSRTSNRFLSIALSVFILGIIAVGLPNTRPAGAAVGLVGRWSFEGSITDLSGNSNNGQTMGTATYGSGKTGNGLVLDGTSNTFAQVASSTSLNSPTTAMTVSMWVKSTASNSWNALVSRQEGTGSSDQFTLMTSGTQVGQYLNTTANGNQGLFGGTITQNMWTHVATTFDGTTLRVYVNGAQVNTAARSGTIVATSNPLIIGGNANDGIPNTAQDLFTGVIDDLCIYNRALTPTELASGNDCTDTPTTTTTASPTTTTTTPLCHCGGCRLLRDSYCE